LGEKYDYTTEGVPLLVADGVTISSTYIRERLEAGEVRVAAAALGRPPRVEGVVVRGHMRGRALGFPTANLECPPHTAIPADGIYAGWLLSLTADGEEDGRWPAAISIGPNATFGEAERTVEAYALDRDDLDLYGAHVAIDFTARLRGTVRFDSVDALVEQMHRDVAEAREILTGPSALRVPGAPGAGYGEALVTGPASPGLRPGERPVCRRSTAAGREARSGGSGGSSPRASTVGEAPPRGREAHRGFQGVVPLGQHGHTA